MLDSGVQDRCRQGFWIDSGMYVIAIGEKYYHLYGYMHEISTIIKRIHLQNTS